MTSTSRLLRQWWSASDSKLLALSESRLLDSLVKQQQHTTHVRKKFNIGGLNVLEFNKIPPSPPAAADRTNNIQQYDHPTTIILTHGFGSGLGFFYRNINDLLQSEKVSRVVCIDWLGMGGSDRPPCWESPIRSFFHSSSSYTSNRFSLCNSHFTTPSRAIDFFLDPLEQVLQNNHSSNDDNDESNHENGIKFHPNEKICLVGHSLGGYLAARFVMRNNNNNNNADGSSNKNNGGANIISKLILASPVGFQPPPPPGQRLPTSNLPPAMRLLDALWSANFTPQQIIRFMGDTRGKRMVERALRGRIPHLSTSDVELLADYLYHITVAPPSGEYAMNSLLEPAVASEGGGAGVYARESLGGGVMTEMLLKNEETNIQSVKVLFGDRDWMAFNQSAAVKEMNEIRAKMGIDANVHVLPGSGHHLYLDNADAFIRHILD
jgi:cardiolipin-specific phospholipase